MEEYFVIAGRLLPAFQKVLQISFSYLPVNEQVSYFVVNTLQKQVALEYLVSTAFLITF